MHPVADYRRELQFPPRGFTRPPRSRFFYDRGYAGMQTLARIGKLAAWELLSCLVVTAGGKIDAVLLAGASVLRRHR